MTPTGKPQMAQMTQMRATRAGRRPAAGSGQGRASERLAMSVSSFTALTRPALTASRQRRAKPGAAGRPGQTRAVIIQSAFICDICGFRVCEIGLSLRLHDVRLG
jgi:hypothetical protein